MILRSSSLDSDVYASSIAADIASILFMQLIQLVLEPIFLKILRALPSEGALIAAKIRLGQPKTVS